MAGFPPSRFAPRSPRHVARLSRGSPPARVRPCPRPPGSALSPPGTSVGNPTPLAAARWLRPPRKRNRVGKKSTRPARVDLHPRSLPRGDRRPTLGSKSGSGSDSPLVPLHGHAKGRPLVTPCNGTADIRPASGRAKQRPCHASTRVTCIASRPGLPLHPPRPPLVGGGSAAEYSRVFVAPSRYKSLRPGIHALFPPRAAASLPPSLYKTEPGRQAPPRPEARSCL